MSYESAYGREPRPHLYRSRLDDVLYTAITPENIDTYTDDALNRVIGIAEDAVTTFRSETYNVYETKWQLEDDAFSHYGLPDINVVLDHIQEVASQLAGINQLIADTPVADEVFIPPDPLERPITPGTGSYEAPRRLPKLKTVLFIISQLGEGGTDIHDPEQVRLNPGSVSDTMMRKLGYTVVDLPTHNRVVLVCDETGNITYVLNRQNMAVRGITAENVTELTKTGIDSRIYADPLFGERVVYSNNYASNVRKATSSDRQYHPYAEIHQMDRAAYTALNERGFRGAEDLTLLPYAPENYADIYEIHRRYSQYGFTFRSTEEMIDRLMDQLGGVLVVRVGQRRVARAFSPAQQDIIANRMARLGFHPNDA